MFRDSPNFFEMFSHEVRNKIPEPIDVHDVPNQPLVLPHRFFERKTDRIIDEPTKGRKRLPLCQPGRSRGEEIADVERCPSE